MFGLFKKKSSAPLKYFTMKKAEVQNVGALAQTALEHWLGFKRYFFRAFSNDPVTTEDEAGFLDVKRQIVSVTRSLGERLSGQDFYYGGDRISALLKQCVSVDHLRSLPLADRKALYKEWHMAFVHLSRTVGAFKLLSEGYVPPPRVVKTEKSGTSIASIKGSQSGAHKKK